MPFHNVLECYSFKVSIDTQVRGRRERKTHTGKNLARHRPPTGHVTQLHVDHNHNINITCIINRHFPAVLLVHSLITELSINL